MIRPDKSAGKSTAIVRRRATLSDTMQRLLSYAGLINVEYGVRHLDMIVIDIADGMMTVSVLSASARVTYQQLTTAHGMMIKYKGVLSMVMDPISDTLEAKAFSITQLRDLILLI